MRSEGKTEGEIQLLLSSSKWGLSRGISNCYMVNSAF